MGHKMDLLQMSSEGLLKRVEGKAGKSKDDIGENIRFTKISYFRHVYFTFSQFLLGGWLYPVVNK